MSEIVEQFGLQLPLMITVSLGFFALLAIMYTKAWPAVTKMLDARAQMIKSRLDDAESKRAEMEQLRNDYEQRLAGIEHEARERIQVAVRDAHAARDELLAAARAQSEQTLTRAQEEIEREKEKALIEIRDQVADLATLAAGQIIGRTLDPQTHRALIDEVIDSVGGRPVGQGASRN